MTKKRGGKHQNTNTNKNKFGTSLSVHTILARLRRDLVLTRSAPGRGFGVRGGSSLFPESLGLMCAPSGAACIDPTPQGLWFHSFLRTLYSVGASVCRQAGKLSHPRDNGHPFWPTKRFAPGSIGPPSRPSVRGGIRFVPREFGPSVRNSRWQPSHPDFTRHLDSFFSTGIVLRQGQLVPLIRQTKAHPRDSPRFGPSHRFRPGGTDEGLARDGVWVYRSSRKNSAHTRTNKRTIFCSFLFPFVFSPLGVFVFCLFVCTRHGPVDWLCASE
jgi:hypothetical protein